MRALDLTLLTDLYELTMMQGYFKNPTDQVVVFDAFYRQNPCDGGYAIAAGLEQVIEYIRDLHFSPDDVEYLRGLNLFDDDFLEYLRGFHFTGDIYAIPEGTVVFPREPLLKVVAPVMEAQLVETAILNIINHQSLIATKASRVVYAAKGDGIMEFGLRRAQGPDAGIYGARAAVIGGCVGTSNVLTGKIRADLICMVDETFDESKDMIIFDPIETWKKTKIKGGTYTLRELLVPIFQKGLCVYTSPSVMEMQAICKKEQETLWPETRRLVNPQKVYVDLSDKLYKVKSQLLEEMSMKALDLQ